MNNKLKELLERGPVALPPPGHDGNPPEFRPARGSEVVDPRSGKVTRESIDGPQNIASDIVEWLLAHHKIESYQHAAAKKLRSIAYSAGRLKYATIGEVHGSRADNFSEARMVAIQELKLIKSYLGPPAWRICEAIVIEDALPVDAARQMGIARDGGIAALMMALGSLAAYFGFAPAIDYSRE